MFFDEVVFELFDGFDVEVVVGFVEYGEGWV